MKVTNEEVVSLPKNEGEQALFSLSAEEQSIVDAAKANGTYMKAPNGKPTNLTERQWANIKSGINALLRIANGEESVPKVVENN